MYTKSFRKIFQPELEIHLYLHDFRKEVSQITDGQTYKEMGSILNKCTNIPGMFSKHHIDISSRTGDITIVILVR